MTIEDIINVQHPIAQGWVCPDCVNYRGKLICEKYCFIAFEGANLSDCRLFERGIRCPHCGKAFRPEAKP